MRTLVVEDDFITSQVMQEILLSFGPCDIAENGKRGIEMFKEKLNSPNHYEVIFLDIMMPEMDGQSVLNAIRETENDHDIMGLDCVKIIMTTALDDFENVKTAFKNQAEGYIVKPIEKDKVVKKLADLDLV